MKDKKPLRCEFCSYRYCQNFVVVVVFFFKTIDEFNNLQLLNDDNELLQAEDLLYKKFPTSSVHFDEYFGVFSSTSAQDPYDTESSKT